MTSAVLWKRESVKGLCKKTLGSDYVNKMLYCRKLHVVEEGKITILSPLRLPISPSRQVSGINNLAHRRPQPKFAASNTRRQLTYNKRDGLEE
jgi:hypothetical protein